VTGHEKFFSSMSVTGKPQQVTAVMLCKTAPSSAVDHTTTRYFVDKFPLFLSGASSAPSPVVGFCYVKRSIGKPSGFDTYPVQYRELFSRVEGFRVIYVAADEPMFPKAERTFRRMCRNTSDGVCVAEIPKSSDCASTLGLVICLSDGRQILLVRQGWTGCEKSWPSFEGRW
jgi:hypothetical protein